MDKEKEMAQILVLIRHGKAQPFKSEEDDAARVLTPAGKRALRASLPESLMPLALMPEFVMGDVEVWSSSAVRAMETAEAAAAMLDVQDIEAHQSLFAQDLDIFLQELSESAADVVVAVGHEPFCGVLSDRLCGVALPFKTASVAIFDLSAFEGDPKDSVLRHFSQGPRTENWKTLTKLEDVLCQGAAKVEQNMTLFLEAPEDVEALHDFRVSIRTLRSELTFLKPYMNPVQVKSLQTKLRDLVVKTSRLRELDVLYGMVSSTEDPNGELLAVIGKMRERECNAVLAEIGKKKAIKRACKLLDQVEHIEWKRHVEEMGLTDEDIIERFYFIQTKFEAEYLKADFEKVEQTHDLRKAAKRVRYAAREFGGILGAAAEGVPEAMRDIQDELGALCDARVNCLIIDDVPTKKLSKQARAALQVLRGAQEAAIAEIIGRDRDPEAFLEEAGAYGPEAIQFDIEMDGMTELAEDAFDAAESVEWESEAAIAAEEMVELIDEVEETAATEDRESDASEGE